MAHLQRELFISLVMDSASDWMVVKVPIIDFIRSVAALHAGAKVSLLVSNAPSHPFLNITHVSSHVSHTSSTLLRTRARRPLTQAHSFAKVIRLTSQFNPCKQPPETIFEGDWDQRS